MKKFFILIILVAIFSGCSSNSGQPMESKKAPQLALDIHNRLQSIWEYHDIDELNYYDLDFNYQGNCREYSAKMKEDMIKHGYPEHLMSLQTCFVPECHQVLLVMSDDGEWFLFEVSGDSGPLHWFPTYEWEENWVYDVM